MRTLGKKKISNFISKRPKRLTMDVSSCLADLPVRNPFRSRLGESSVLPSNPRMTYTHHSSYSVWCGCLLPCLLPSLDWELSESRHWVLETSVSPTSNYLTSCNIAVFKKYLLNKCTKFLILNHQNHNDMPVSLTSCYSYP